MKRICPILLLLTSLAIGADTDAAKRTQEKISLAVTQTLSTAKDRKKVGNAKISMDLLAERDATTPAKATWDEVRALLQTIGPREINHDGVRIVIGREHVTFEENAGGAVSITSKLNPSQILQAFRTGIDGAVKLWK